MHRVKTTFRPDEEIEVDDAEYVDLKAQGLLVEETSKPSGKAKQANESGAAGDDK